MRFGPTLLGHMLAPDALEAVLPAFSRTELATHLGWTGNADCDAGHLWLLECLRARVDAFLPTGTTLTNAIVGNLGEFIAFSVGAERIYADLRPFPANAFDPLSSISRPSIDIVWIRFGDTASEDLLVLQEVKASPADPNLSVAASLVADYDKLFGTDPLFTLRSRLQVIKNELELKMRRLDLAERVDVLAGKSPGTSPLVWLTPTLVHERNVDAGTRLSGIRTALLGRGWDPDAVVAWGIALTDLGDRLERLATGRP
jgi:hypothetical protein